MASYKAGETVEVMWSSGNSVVNKSVRLSAAQPALLGRRMSPGSLLRRRNIRPAGKLLSCPSCTTTAWVGKTIALG